MKTGKTLTELVAEIDRQQQAKKDFIAPTTQLRMVDGNRLSVPNQGEFEVTEHAHNQIGERLGIPAKYYDRMRKEAPALLANNVNHWFQEKPERRMVRTMTLERPEARAFLSDRYRRLDNFDLAMNVLPDLLEKGQQLQIVSSEITWSKLYIKWTTPRVSGEVVKGDVVQAGGVITNSEVGMGRISVFPFVTRLVCINGMTMEEFGQARHHVGRAAASDEEAYELFEDDTLKADDRAFWMKVRDTVRAVTRQDRFNALLQRMRESTQKKIEGDVPQAVEVLANNYNLGDTVKSGILRHLIADNNGLTAWGLSNAITATSAEVSDYNEASDLERLGGQVLTLAPTEWKTIATAKI